MGKLFTHLQCLGLKVNTFPEKIRNFKGYANMPGPFYGWEIWGEDASYIGLSDPEEDVRGRLEVMKAAIEKVATSGKVHSFPSTLKLFMSPEFFFRGCRGAYSDMNTIHTIREGLEEIVSDPKYASWLFVFGSVLAVVDMTDLGGKKEAYNFAYVIPGGGSGETRLVMKELKSGIDFIKGQVDFPRPGVIIEPVSGTPYWVVDEEVQHLRAATESGAGRERQKGKYGAYSGNGIIDYENVTFGIEVCLDHLAQRLKKSPPAKGDWRLQFQLIPSAGMTIKPESVVAQKNGYVFNVDGGRPEIKMAKVTTEGTRFTDAVVNEVAGEEVPFTFPPLVFDGLFLPQTPSMMIYPKVQLPLRSAA